MSRSSSSTQPHPTKENPYILSKKIKYSRKSPIFSRKIPTQCVLHCVCCSGCVAVCCSVLQWMCGNVLLSKDPYSAIPFREQVYSLAKDPCILLKEPYVLSIYPNNALSNRRKALYFLKRALQPTKRALQSLSKEPCPPEKLLECGVSNPVSLFGVVCVMCATNSRLHNAPHTLQHTHCNTHKYCNTHRAT